jgi:hypothetical protein
MMCTGRGIYLEKNTENWSGKRDLNPRPSPWQGDALPLSYSRSIAVFEEERGGILLIQERSCQAIRWAIFIVVILLPSFQGPQNATKR